MIQSQFWAASTRTFSETFPQNGHRTDDQRSVSTILKECLGQLLGPNRRKPTERDEIGPVRHHRRESASPALPHLRIRIRFIFVSRKIGEISRLFEGLKASDQLLNFPRSLQRNGLPPPQHNLVEVRLSPPPPMATRRRTMDGRLAEDAMILIDTRRQSRVASAVAAGKPRFIRWVGFGKRTRSEGCFWRHERGESWQDTTRSVHEWHARETLELLHRIF